MSENLRVIRFAVIVCLACSVLVSTAALGLRERQEANLRLDIRKNILASVALYEAGLPAEEVNRLFDERMVGLVVDRDGAVVKDRSPEDVNPETEPDLLPLYQCTEYGKVVAYTFPIEGPGLWSTLYGYFALEGDLETVKGITFYKHAETPGLGGEVDKAWFQQQFIGKKVLDGGEVVSVTVVKGKAEDQYPDDLEHYVDGISGATITANGVTLMLEKALRAYEPYFGTLRGEAS